MKKPKKICTICGMIFEARRKDQKTCSPKCSKLQFLRDDTCATVTEPVHRPSQPAPCATVTEPASQPAPCATTPARPAIHAPNTKTNGIDKEEKGELAMSFIATIEDGEAIKQSFRKFEKIDINKTLFGRLTFSVDCSYMSLRDAWDFVEQLNQLDEAVTVFVDIDRKIDFDYYITADLLPIIRGIVCEFTDEYFRGRIINWEYTEN